MVTNYIHLANTTQELLVVWMSMKCNRGIASMILNIVQYMIHIYYCLQGSEERLHNYGRWYNSPSDNNSDMSLISFIIDNINIINLLRYQILLSFNEHCSFIAWLYRCKSPWVETTNILTNNPATGILANEGVIAGFKNISYCSAALNNLWMHFMHPSPP